MSKTSKNSDMKCSLHRFVTRPRLVLEFLVTEGFVSMFDLSFAAFWQYFVKYLKDERYEEGNIYKEINGCIQWTHLPVKTKLKQKSKEEEFRNFYMHVAHSGQLSAQTFYTVCKIINIFRTKDYSFIKRFLKLAPKLLWFLMLLLHVKCKDLLIIVKANCCQ